MKIFYIGSVQFSREILEAVITNEGVEIVGIATKSASKFNSDHSDLSDIADSHGIPFKFVKDINAPHILQWIESLRADVVFCFGWSALIKNELLTLCEKGVIGYHPSDLPQNRGRHPIIWALALGLEETASCFFHMTEGADDGDIVSKVKVKILDEDNALSLYRKLTKTAKDQIPLVLRKLKENIEFEVQDHSISNYWRKRGKQDGAIDFRMTSRAIYNLVRALAKPYVGAHLVYNSQEYKVWRSEIGPIINNNLEPGKILKKNKESFLVKTGDGSIWITHHELDLVPAVNEYIL